MKIFQIYRLGFKRGFLLLPAYLGEKVFNRKKLKNQNVLIIYFNILVNFKLQHVEETNDYFIVKRKDIGSFALRKPNSSDANVFKQVFIEEEYNELCRLVKKYFPPGEVKIIDGGANIGLTSIYLKQGIEGTHQLNAILVEPATDNLRMIHINLELQGIKSFNVEGGGLYNKPGYLKIKSDFRDGLEWSIQVEESKDKTELKAIEINSLLQKYHWEKLDILKLDIEGSEKFLFQDETYAASFLSKTSILAVELHEELINSELTLKMLAENGFELSKFGELYIGVNKNIVNRN